MCAGTLPLFFQGDGEGVLTSVRSHTSSCLPEYGVALLPPTLPCPVQTEVNSSLVMVSALRGATEELGRGRQGTGLSAGRMCPHGAECVAAAPVPCIPPGPCLTLWARRGAHSDAPLLALSGPCVLGCSNWPVSTVGTVTSSCCWATRRTL